MRKGIKRSKSADLGMMGQKKGDVMKLKNSLHRFIK